MGSARIGEPGCGQGTRSGQSIGMDGREYGPEPDARQGVDSRGWSGHAGLGLGRNRKGELGTAYRAWGGTEGRACAGGEPESQPAWATGDATGPIARLASEEP